MEYAERFWAKVDKTHPSGCWIWKASTTPNGYGKFKLNGHSFGAHRISYIMAYGPIASSDINVCHRCDNPLCVNPAHMFLGDDTANMQDMLAKGRRTEARGERVGGAKLKTEYVMEMRRLRSEGWSQKMIAKVFGVARAHVSLVVRGKSWAHV